MGEAENSQAKAYDLSGRQEADRGGTASKLGESEEGSLKESANRCLSHQQSMVLHSRAKIQFYCID